MKIPASAMAMLTMIAIISRKNTASVATARKAIAHTGKLASQVKWRPLGFYERGDLSLPDATDKSRKYSEVQLKCDRAAVPECEKLLAHSVGHPVTITGKAEFVVLGKRTEPLVQATIIPSSSHHQRFVLRWN